MRYYNNQMIDGDDGSHPFSPYYVEVESDAPSVIIAIANKKLNVGSMLI